MVNWKNLRADPPKKDCDICVKIGSSYDTYKFKIYSECNWGLIKHPKTIDSYKVPEEALYINLDEIR
jgi:hypothetical protein